MMDIKYSDGTTVSDAIIQVWDDLHEELPGFYRAFWCDGPDATIGSPIVGYCSPGGSFRTIRETALDAARRHPGIPIYRNGQMVNGVKMLEALNVEICELAGAGHPDATPEQLAAYDRIMAERADEVRAAIEAARRVPAWASSFHFVDGIEAALQRAIDDPRVIGGPSLDI